MEKNSSGDGNIEEKVLTAVTGGIKDINNHFDPLRCNVCIPDSKCNIRNDAERCCHLIIETIPSGKTTPEKHRYICMMGGFEYISDTDIHSIK